MAICPICGVEFRKKRHVTTCGRTCGQRLAWQRNRDVHLSSQATGHIITLNCTYCYEAFGLAVPLERYRSRMTSGRAFCNGREAALWQQWRLRQADTTPAARSSGANADVIVDFKAREIRNK